MFESLSKNFKRVLITGGAGFIGSNLVKTLLKDKDLFLINLDKLSYSSDQKGQLQLEKENAKNFKFIKSDLFNEIETRNIIDFYKPDLVINLAAESHVDRSLINPRIFLESNTIGTFNLLEGSRNYWEKLSINKKEIFKFIHVSTDEVFGSLKNSGKFSESSPYKPSSPYSASKAASDHFVFAWNKTFKMPTLISNCSNNYGPKQFPEKLIPLTILKIIRNSSIPVYGNGENIRDWLFVDDHISGLIQIALNGTPGKRYCIGGNNEISNLELIKLICKILDTKIPRENESFELVKFVKDRPGHDYRYAIDSTLMNKELNWEAKTTLSFGIEQTVDWYLNNLSWCEMMLKESNYNLTRLGL